MKKESIDKVLELIVNSNIDLIDKIELLINLKLFFIEYEENIKILSEKKLRRKYEKN